MATAPIGQLEFLRFLEIWRSRPFGPERFSCIRAIDRLGRSASFFSHIPNRDIERVGDMPPSPSIGEDTHCRAHLAPSANIRSFQSIVDSF